MGECGTTGAVIGAIERGGGASGDLDFDTPMLRRIGVGEHQHGSVARSRRLTVRWHQLPTAHQRTALALYCGRTLLVQHVSMRFGDASGVAIALWCSAKPTKGAERRPSIDRDLRGLSDACQNGAPSWLTTGVDAAVAALHRAWQSTATPQDRARTTREDRQERVHAFLVTEGL